MKSPFYARMFWFLSAVGSFSLFPLLINHNETLIKAGVLFVYLRVSHDFFKELYAKYFSSFSISLFN